MDSIDLAVEQGLLMQSQGNRPAAQQMWRQVLTQSRDHVGALYHLGTSLLEESQFTEALHLLERAASLQPKIAVIQNNLGIVYKEQSRFGDAAQCFERALAIDGHFSSAYHNLGDLAESLGQIETALNLYHKALELDPASPQTHLKLARLLFRKEAWSPAADCYAIALDSPAMPLDEASWLELASEQGLALLRCERLAEAAAVFEKMVLQRPDLAVIHNNLAFVYERSGDGAAAVRAAQRALELQPNFAAGHNNLGVAWRSLHDFAKAQECFAKAQELDPAYALARFNEGTARLMQGDFAQGWELYEARRELLPRGTSELPPALQWSGTAARIPAETLFVVCEQGYGDSFQFARFLNLAKERWQGRVVVEGPADVGALLSPSLGVDEFRAAGTARPAFSHWISLPSLPCVLNIRMDDLPACDFPYLRVDDAAVNRWRTKFTALLSSYPAAGRQYAGGADRRLSVGLVWQGNRAQSEDVHRSMTLAQLAPLANVPGITWVSLQKGDMGESQLDQPDNPFREIVRLPGLNSFVDTAAALSSLDLVITVDTSVAHLAGALGKPVWTLLCDTPDWRWHCHLDHSPWYPSMRLFRQPKFGDWNSACQEVARELSKLR